MSTEKINYVWLVFHYETNKLSSLTGRQEDKENSKADIVFKYTTASIKSFIAHNPEKAKDITIFTDDVKLIKENIKKYINQDIDIKDISEDINKWKNHSYPWNPKASFLKYLKSEFNTSIFFIDNDCICKNSTDDLEYKIKSEECIVLWELERVLTDTRPYWGWQKTAKYLNKPLSYKVFNNGIIGINKKHIEEGIFDVNYAMCLDIWKNIDLTNIPGRPNDYMPKKLFISEQISLSFVAQDKSLKIYESKNYFDHHYADKLLCLKYL
mgnify:CR=1 FL=1